MSATSSTCGGKISTCRPYSPRTCSLGVADRRRRGDDQRPHRLAVGRLPGRKGLHRDLEQPDRGAQRPGDQMQLVLDDQVRRAQPVDGTHRGRGVTVRWRGGRVVMVQAA